MLKRKISYNLIKIASAALCLIIAFTAATFSWFSRYNTVSFPNAYGGAAKAAYFAGGDGSKNDPYQIKTAVHLYNFAWLQYLGYFNLNSTLNNGRAQSYFKLSDNIDMSVLKSALPPIGTSQYPFIGGFSGENFTIYNLTVSNQKSDLTVRPVNAHIASDTDTNAGRLLSATQSGEVCILGLFGAVGDYNNFLTDNYKGKSVNGAEIVINDSSTDLPADQTQIAVNDFYHKGMYVKNFYADKVHVKSYSKKTLLGIAAGYVNAAMQNVGVYRCDASFAAGATGLTDDYGTIVSKYSLIGDYNEKAVSWSEDPTSGSTGGDDGGWGGSIDMKSLFTRLTTFRSSTSKQYVDASFNDSTSGNIRYYDKKQGSYYFTSGGSTLVRLYGGLITKDYEIKTNNQSGFYISSNGKYFTINGLYSTGAAFPTSNIEEAVTWYYDETEKSLYAYANDDKIYLNLNISGITNLSTVQTVQWTKQNNQLCATVQNAFNGKIYTYTYYLSYSGSQWKGDRSTQNLTLTDSNGTCRYYVPKYAYSGTVNNGTEQRNFATYIPLLVDENNNAIKRNTGYIASGSTTRESNSITGDIRVRQDTLGTALKESLNGATTYKSGTTIKIYTRTSNSGGFINFSDVYGSATNGKNLGLVKYESSKLNGLDPMLNESDKIYGMHFMNAPIDIDNIYRADYAVIENSEYENYQMAANSIDFSVKSRGYINFFAGTYYNGSDKNFFSLHEIKRNNNKEIIEIKEISKIYANKNNPKSKYVYLYEDGDYSGDYSAETYQLLFDTEWITNPEMVMYAVYYFEIPVNAGEYALGSASTGDGAYLMYLDIGANGNEGSEVPSPGNDKDYYMSGVDFVNASSVTLDENGEYPAFKDVTVALSDVSETESAQTIYMRNNDGALDQERQIADTLRYKYKNITAVVSPKELGDDKSDDDTFVPSTDSD